MKSKQG